MILLSSFSFFTSWPECPICRTSAIVRILTAVGKMNIRGAVWTRWIKTFFVFFIRQINHVMMGFARNKKSNAWTYKKPQKIERGRYCINKQYRSYGHEYHRYKKCEKYYITPISNTTPFGCIQIVFLITGLFSLRIAYSRFNFHQKAPYYLKVVGHRLNGLTYILIILQSNITHHSHLIGYYVYK